MTASRKAIAAAPAHDVTLAADDVSGVKIADVRPHLDNLSDELVPNRHGNGDRLLRPIVPLVNMNVCSADPGALHPNQYIVDAGPRSFNLFQPQSGFPLTLAQCFHESSLSRTL